MRNTINSFEIVKSKLHFNSKAWNIFLLSEVTEKVKHRINLTTNLGEKDAN
jgi:hypothetical protein